MAALKIPEISGRQRWLLCSLYLAIVGIALLYYRFPEERFRRYLVAELSRRIPDVRITIGRVRPLLPPGLVCHHVTIYHRQAVMVENVGVSVYPNWSSWLGSSSKTRFELRVGDGVVDGTVRLVKENGIVDYGVTAQLEAIAIGEIAALKTIINRPVQGTLSGQVAVRQENQTTEGQAQLTLTDGVAGVNIPGVDVQTLEWEALKAELKLKGAKLEIQRGSLSGNQISGQINGTILIRTPWETSRLRLQAAITPKPALMAQLKQSQWGPLLSQMPSPSQGVKVRLRGTVNKPSVSLK